MKFPARLKIAVVDAISGLPISNVALLLILRAQRKNDFPVGPVITDQFGHAEFTKEDCESAIERSKKMFLMDYWGDLESCKSSAEIELHDPDNISRMIENYRAAPSFWGAGFADAPELFAALKCVRNSEFEPAKLLVCGEEICEFPGVQLLLRRK